MGECDARFATSNRQAYQSLPNLLTWTLGERMNTFRKPTNDDSNLYPPFTSQRSESELDTMSNRMTYISQRERLEELSQHLFAMLNGAEHPGLGKARRRGY